MRQQLAQVVEKKKHPEPKSSTEPDFYGPEDWEYESQYNRHQKPYDPAEKLEQDNVCL